jgi:hypothetical protein
MRRPGPEAGFAAGAAVLASAAAGVVLELWNADLRVPFSYTGDGVLNLMLIKSVMERGWFYENPRLGAPNEQQLYDYPVLSGDGMHVLFFWLGALFTDSPALVMNVFFLLTFPVTAVVAYLVLRRLAVGREVAFVIAVLYTLLPYHFIRGETHLFLAAYYAAPLGVYLALSVLDGRLTIGVTTAALAALVAVVSGSFYYSAFTVLLVVVAAVLRWLVTRERSAASAAGFVVGVILAVSLIQLAPTILYRANHGTNDEVAKRYWFESENYALKITHLVLPVDGHRVDALADLKDEYIEQIPPTERGATLGVVGTAGFLWLLAVAVVACLGGARLRNLRAEGRLAALAVVAVLVATVGGLSTLIAVIWPQIRAWNRISVFIAFIALVAIALLLEALRKRVPRGAFVAVLVAVLAIGVADQTTSGFVPNYGELEVQYETDESWVRTLEQRLPAQAMVVQLPYEPFPEPEPTPGRPPYEPAKAYLHSSDLRWSFGATKGRPDDWAAANATRPAAELVQTARKAGFAGIHVDRLAYPDQGVAAEADLRGAVGSEPDRSPDGRYLFWEL